MLGTISLLLPLALGQTCGPVDLETALALASKNSDEVAVKRLEVTAAEADLSLARAARWIPSTSLTFLTGPSPEARGSIENGATKGSARDPFSGLSVFGRVEASVVQPLYTWGRLDAAEAAAKAGVGAREHLVKDTASQVQLRIVQLFWGEILARRLLEIAGEVENMIPEVEKQLDAELKASKERYEAAVTSHQASKSWTRSVGLDPGAEVGDAKDAIEAYLAYVENRIELATATYELTLARARYNQATGVAPFQGQPKCLIQ